MSRGEIALRNNDQVCDPYKCTYLSFLIELLILSAEIVGKLIFECNGQVLFTGTTNWMMENCFNDHALFNIDFYKDIEISRRALSMPASIKAFLYRQNVQYRKG